LFVDGSGDKIREFNYTFSDDSFSAKDLSVLSPLDNEFIKDIIFQQDPDRIIWAANQVMAFSPSLAISLSKLSSSSSPEDQVADIQVAHKVDALFVVHPEVPPQSVFRAGITNWTVTTIDFNWGEGVSSPWSPQQGYPGVTTFYENRLDERRTMRLLYVRLVCQPLGLLSTGLQLRKYQLSLELLGKNHPTL
jgi:hypothetical protein